MGAVDTKRAGATSRWADEVVEKGQAVYAEKIRPSLTDADKGKYIAVHVETGEWLMADTLEEHDAQTFAKFGAGEPVFSLRAGYRSIFTFRPGLKLEMDEW